MADYDSDSSGSENENNDISTNVLLGYASKDPTVDDFSQLGGLPTWLDPTTTPDGRLARCRVCNGLLCLLLQIWADLPECFPGHERRLYILGCRRKACRRKEGSVRAFRAVRHNEVEKVKKQDGKAKKPVVNLGEALFGAKSPTPAQSNPFAAPSAGNSSANPFSSASTASTASGPSNQPPAVSTDDTLAETFAQKARISADSASTVPDTPSPTPEPWPTDPKPFSSYYIDADKEYLDPAFGTEDVPASARVETNGESSSSGGGGEDKALFESTMDKTFQRFADRLAQNPEQVLRYEFGGQPLLYSKDDAVGKLLAPAQEAKVHTQSGTSSKSKMTACTNCGAARVFEVQLTPHAITELEADEVAIDGMEWGTVIVGVCSSDCQERGRGQGEVGYVEEWAGVQWEEVADHRQR